MELVKVKWFNKLKGFGEGKTSDGRRVFLHYTALGQNGERVDLEPDQELQAELKMDGARLIAYTLRPYHGTSRTELKNFSR